MSGSGNAPSSGGKVRQHIEKRLKGGTAYGVPYSVISLTDYESTVPADVLKSAREKARKKLTSIPAPLRMALSLDEDSLTKKMIWMRSYKTLSQAERDFLENKVDVIVDKKRPGFALGPIGFGRQSPESVARKLFFQVGIARLMNPGMMDMAYMQVDQQEAENGIFAHQQGRSRYKDRKGAVIIFDKQDAHPEQALGKMLGFRKGEMAPLNGSAENLHALILEHELAHVSGAGEAQADAMSAVQYMRLTGQDDMVRFFSDFRAVAAVWGEVMLKGAEDMAQKKGRGLFGLKGMLRDKMLKWQREMSGRYGWGCVEALDEQLQRGVQGAKAMTGDEIHDMRFNSYGGDKWPLRYLGELVQEHAKPSVPLLSGLMKGFNKASFALPGPDIHAVAQFCDSLKSVNDPRLQNVRDEYKQDVVNVARRFAKAARNILTAQPQQRPARPMRFAP